MQSLVILLGQRESTSDIWGALKFSAQFGYMELLEALIENVNVVRHFQNLNFRDLLEIAIKSNHPEVIDFIL